MKERKIELRLAEDFIPLQLTENVFTDCSYSNYI